MRRLLLSIGLLAPAFAAAAGPASSFEDLSSTLGELDFTAVAADPQDGKLVYAAAAGVVYRSKDGGRSFEVILGRQGSAARATTDDTVATVSRERDVRADELFEQAADALREEIEEEIVDRLEEELGEDEARQIAVVEAEREVERATARLREEARKRAERELPLRGDVPAEVSGAEGFQRVNELRCPTPGELLVSTDDGLWRSTDAGATMRMLALGSSTGAVRAADADPELPGRLYAATAGGLEVSEGGIFSSAAGEVGDASAYAVDVDDGEPTLVLVATEVGLFLSHDGGRRFAPVPLSGGDAAVLAAGWDQGAPKRAYAATRDGGLFVSEDAGESFERRSPAGLRGQVRRIHAPPTPAGEDPRLFLTTDAGIFVSRDGGDEFEELFEGLAVRDVRAVATPVGFPGTPYAATSRGLFMWGGEGRKLPPDVRAELKKLAAREPTADELYVRALAFAQLEPERTESMRTRVSLAPLAPQFSLWLFRGGSLTVREGDHGTYVMDSDFYADGMDWAAWAGWDLARVVYDTNELAVERESERVLRRRQQLSGQIVRALLARRRLLAEHLGNEKKDLRGRALRLLQIEEQTARLDGLTGGWFSEELARRAQREAP